jgi:hypothetical protein
LQSVQGEQSLKLLSSRLWIFHARVRRRGLDEAAALTSTIVSTAVVILINMTRLACFFLTIDDFKDENLSQTVETLANLTSP